MVNYYDYTTTWTFRKPTHFWKKLGVQMKLDNLNDSNYSLVFFDSLPSNFNSCVDSNGCLKNSATGMSKVSASKYSVTPFQLGVSYLDSGENGFTLFLNSNSVTHIPISSPFYCQGVALVKVSGSSTGSNYVVAYSKLSTKIYCNVDITLQPKCEFVGHSSCKEA